MADDIFHIGRTESWFSVMARKGLHLEKLGLFFITFEKGEPRNTKYRIDILGGNPSEEQLNVYRACGWGHVGQSSHAACVCGRSGHTGAAYRSD